MKDEFVSVKATSLQYGGFKRLGESYPSEKDLNKAIERKTYLSPEQAKTAKSNKKMLWSFMSIRVIGENTLAEFKTDNNYSSIVIGVPVLRKDVKGNVANFIFLSAVKDLALTYFTPEELQDTHLQVNGVINSQNKFGIHYTILIPKELGDKLAEMTDSIKHFSKISTLKAHKNFDEISGYCIGHYKEVEETHSEDNKMQS